LNTFQFIPFDIREYISESICGKFILEREEEIFIKGDFTSGLVFGNFSIVDKKNKMFYEGKAKCHLLDDKERL
jgi:hypothetical protein